MTPDIMGVGDVSKEAIRPANREYDVLSRETLENVEPKVLGERRHFWRGEGEGRGKEKE